ncbi:hypothetical protein GCM10010082_07760 [Kushneria pakistanensis]|uniref:Uncharacterized protein n=1 Tax=Kushneria pakistanensis TaxID=1508770 RepID=A0ABQ3FD15_9GAMM|nr:hypothetical protein [Kushneria pakistanensis]GHC18773.1 hypothetical protein GCM10010082_07760 [Kushneria pakistanensis]
MWKALSLKGLTIKKITVAVAITIVTTAGTYGYASEQSWWFTPAHATPGMCS